MFEQGVLSLWLKELQPCSLVREPLEVRSLVYFRTELGAMVLGDSNDTLQDLPEKSVDLVMTSPPFGLIRKKGYGNADAGAYLDWFRPFADAIHRVIKDTGSLVIDIGGSWQSGQPTRNLYHFKLLIMLCEEFGFHLAQEFYWWNPARLPTPAEWVTVRRIRVKDAVDCIWWLSKTPWPRADNRRVLHPYSASMEQLLENGYKSMKRPSGHDISQKFRRNNGAAIPPNLIALAHTESNSQYLRYCRDRGIAVHPARYPSALPEMFVRMLTDEGDLVVDPFAGSCVTGEVSERLRRRWLCCEIVEEYLEGAVGRFQVKSEGSDRQVSAREHVHYKISKPGALWTAPSSSLLPVDGGKRGRSKSPADLSP